MGLPLFEDGAMGSLSAKGISCTKCSERFSDGRNIGT
jgi:hypothetical protein